MKLYDDSLLLNDSWKFIGNFSVYFIVILLHTLAYLSLTKLNEYFTILYNFKILTLVIMIVLLILIWFLEYVGFIHYILIYVYYVNNINCINLKNINNYSFNNISI